MSLWFICRFVSSESFAELRAETAPIVFSAPVYSLENICTPRFSIRLLVEGFWENSDLMVLAQSALHRSAQLTVRLSRTSAEQLTCSTQLLGFVPMRSDSQQFVRVAGWFETFTIATPIQLNKAPTPPPCRRFSAREGSDADVSLCPIFVPMLLQSPPTHKMHP
jgi:hypothetical protein